MIANAWPTAIPPLLLGDEVHIWLATLDLPPAIVTQLASDLVADERRHADRFRFALDRQRYLVAHAFLRQVLSAYSGVPTTAIEFVTGTYGKPSLLPRPDIPDLRFNLSHSQNHALLAISKGRDVGVDIEYMRPLDDADLIAQHFFSVPEQATLKSLALQQKQSAFYRCWSRKEAFIKGVGLGLTMPLDQFSVSLAPAEPARLTHLAESVSQYNHWILYDLPIVQGYATALAVSSACHTITCHTWAPAPR